MLTEKFIFLQKKTIKAVNLTKCRNLFHILNINNGYSTLNISCAFALYAHSVHFCILKNLRSTYVEIDLC